MENKAPQIYELDPGDRVSVALSFVNRLAADETITSATVVQTAPATPSLTIEGVGANTAVMDINYVSTGIGKAVVCYVSTGTINIDYTLKVTAVTNLLQTRVGYIVTKCR